MLRTTLLTLAALAFSLPLLATQDPFTGESTAKHPAPVQTEEAVYVDSITGQEVDTPVFEVYLPPAKNEIDPLTGEKVLP